MAKKKAILLLTILSAGFGAFFLSRPAGFPDSFAGAASFLTRNNDQKIEELNSSLKEMNSLLKEFKRKIFLSEQKEEEALQEIEELKQKLEIEKETVVRLEKMLERQEKASQLREQEYKREIEEHKKEIALFRTELEKLREAIDQLKDEMETLNTAVSKMNEGPVLCQKQEGEEPRRDKVIFNEISWMGGVDSPADEWIELKNLSGEDIDLSGWQIYNKDKKIRIVFPEEVGILKNGFFLLKRSDDSLLAGIKPDFIYKGGLKNENEALYLFDKNCQLEDEVFASSTWPAGDNSTKRTMERKPDLNWQTSKAPGGTPKAENSSGYRPQKSASGRASGGGSFSPPSKQEEFKPQISFACPQRFPVDKEIEVSLSVSNLESAAYDVKISIESEQNKTLSEIYDQKSGKWQSSYKYISRLFSGSSFLGKFQLRIKESKKDFRGRAKIIAKIRESEKKQLTGKAEKEIIIELPEGETPTLSTETSNSNSGCINLNTAPKEDLIKIKWIGEKTAEQIIQEREKTPFASFEDFQNRIKGIGSAKIEDIKHQACL